MTIVMGKNTSLYKAGVICLLIVSLLYACKSQNIEEDQTGVWDAFVEFKEGNIPLIIVATHGGDLKPN